LKRVVFYLSSLLAIVFLLFYCLTTKYSANFSPLVTFHLPKLDERFMDFPKSCPLYLQNHLNWFLVIDKMKNSTSKMTTAAAIAFAFNSTWFEYKQQLFNMLIRT
jgi:hypothetical protein